MQTRTDAARLATADEEAKELSDAQAGRVAKVGTHRTNGRLYVQVHVTHPGDAQESDRDLRRCPLTFNVR
jgi:hypothetical protein